MNIFAINFYEFMVALVLIGVAVALLKFCYCRYKTGKCTHEASNYYSNPIDIGKAVIESSTHVSTSYVRPTFKKEFLGTVIQDEAHLVDCFDYKINNLTTDQVMQNAGMINTSFID